MREIPEHEIINLFSRSSGKGGQNVNKVSSKVVLSFDLGNSKALSEEGKLLLETKLYSAFEKPAAGLNV